MKSSTFANAVGPAETMRRLSSLALVMALMFAFVLSGAVSWGNLAFADGRDSVISDIGKAVEQKLNEMTKGKSAEAPESGEQLPAVDYTSHVGELMQNDVDLLSGCEITSLCIALESMGIEADIESIINDHLDMNGSYSTGYAGDPYWMGGGFAPGIANAANSYLESINSSVRAYDITGASFNEVSELVAKGYPVLTWTTMYFEDPYLTDMFDEEDEWYENEHCVVLYGFSDDGQTAYVSDPLEGLVERETSRFADIYEQCGSRAIILH